MGDDIPAVFVIDEGEEFWFMPQGPQSASSNCDLGLGPGVTAGRRQVPEILRTRHGHGS